MSLTKSLKYAVTDFVRLACYDGGLGVLSTYYGETNALQEGRRLHSEVQALHPYFTPEKHIDCEVFGVALRGRADLYYESDETLHLIEIKTGLADFFELDAEDIERMFAQLKVYALMSGQMCAQKKKIVLELIYIHQVSSKQRTVRKEFTLAEIEKEMRPRFEYFKKWLAQLDALREREKTDLELLPFLYPEFRTNQRDMTVYAYQVLKGSGHSLVDAPTGIGKTASMLFAGLKTLAQHDDKKLYYATSKSSVKNQVSSFATKSLDQTSIRTCELTSKQKVCFNTDKRCDSRDCQFAKNYFAKARAALAEGFASEQQFDRARIDELARKHEACPFELSLDISRYSRVMVGDLNYVFDPLVRLQRHFNEEDEMLLVVDEAHNAPSRLRDMYSVSISLAGLRKLEDDVEAEAPQALEVVKPIVKLFAARAKKMTEDSQVTESVPRGLMAKLDKANAFLRTEYGEKEMAIPDVFAPLQNWYYRLQFLIELPDQSVFRIIEEGGERGYVFNYFCLDPRVFLRDVANTIMSSVWFSATLRPSRLFSTELQIFDKMHYKSFGSPFVPEQTDVKLRADIDLRYKNREQSIPKIIKLIEELGQSTENSMIFFSSYGFMKAVMAEIPPELYERLHVQGKGIDEKSQELFLERFRTQTGVIGCCVLGSYFSEGVDLVGDSLKNVVVLGVGIPAPSGTQNALQEYWNDQGENGFDFAYRFPGIVRVLQASGRLIRSESDTGQLILCDSRMYDIMSYLH
ncbi:MAG: ATP-dependent DNA helicase, partial [Bdellovibrionota bacterium]